MNNSFIRLLTHLESNPNFPKPSAQQTELKEALERYEDRLDRLSLTCAALWSLLVEKFEITEEELLQRIQELDLNDGTADGKFTRGVLTCTKCQRPMSVRHRRCLYCGSEEIRQGPFDL